MAHLPVFEPVGEFSSDITGTIVAEQAWFMQHMSLITVRCGQRQLKRIGYVFCTHGRAQLPRNDIAGEVVEDGGEIIPTPTDDFEIGKVGLPQLVRCSGLVFELAGRLHHDKGRTGNQDW